MRTDWLRFLQLSVTAPLPPVIGDMDIPLDCFIVEEFKMRVNFPAVFQKFQGMVFGEFHRYFSSGAKENQVRTEIGNYPADTGMNRGPGILRMAEAAAP